MSGEAYRIPPGLERMLIPRPLAALPWHFESIIRPPVTMPWEPGPGDLPHPPIRWRVVQADVDPLPEVPRVHWREILLVDRLRELGFNLPDDDEVRAYGAG